MSSSESSTKRELLEALAYYNKSLNPQSATPNPPSANFSSTEPFAFPEEFVYSAYIGVYMIPVRDRRLERVNIEGITIPKYIDQGFWHLAKEVGYVAFASDLQRNNREMVLSRMQTEACWMLEITRRYQEWDPRQQAALAADPLLPGAWMFKSRMLDQAKEQMKAQPAWKFWLEKRNRNPQLNIKSAYDQMSRVEEIDYQMWAQSLEPDPREELTEIDRELLGDFSGGEKGKEKEKEEGDMDIEMTDV